MGGNDPTIADAVYLKCKEDRRFWFDTFAYTFNPKLANPHIPMILWPFQADYVEWIADRIYLQESGLTEKTREMTETWSKIGTLGWFFCFDDNAQFQVGSRKEELVDGKHPDAIMPKLDYLFERLPRWLLDRCVGPEYTGDKPWRTFKNMTNPRTRSNLYGEATNKNFGRGGRRRAIAIDEAAFIEDLEQIIRSAGMNTNCLLLGSTPNGMGGHFAKMRFSMPERLIYRIHWTKHPEWAKGLYKCAPGCKAHSQGGADHSPKYDAACDVFNWDPVAIAQELDIDYSKSGNPVFDVDMVRKVRVFISDAKPTMKPTALEFKSSSRASVGADITQWYRITRTWPVVAKPSPTSSLRVYKEPFSCREKRCVCLGTGKHVYVQGGDVSKGLDHGDNSVAVMLDVTAGEFVAAWAGKCDPDLVGIEWAKVAKWFGRSSGNDQNAFSGIEWNENGITVNKVMDLMGIPLFIHKSDDKVRGKQVADKLGVVVQPHNRGRLIKEYMIPWLGRPADGSQFPALVMPFDEFWQEAETFVLLTPRTGELNPEKPKAGAMRGKHDDWLWAACHAVYVAIMHYGKVKGVLRHQQRLSAPAESRVLQSQEKA